MSSLSPYKSLFAIFFILQTAAAQQSESPAPTMPKVKRSDDFRPPSYPPSLLRSGATGKVVAAFSIDAAGRAKRLEITPSGHSKLDELVKKDMANMQFDVPVNWPAAGSESARYVLTYIFDIDKTGAGCADRSRSIEAENTIVVCASLIHR